MNKHIEELDRRMAEQNDRANAAADAGRRQRAEAEAEAAAERQRRRDEGARQLAEAEAEVEVKKAALDHARHRRAWASRELSDYQRDHRHRTHMVHEGLDAMSARYFENIDAEALHRTLLEQADRLAGQHAPDFPRLAALYVAARSDEFVAHLHTLIDAEPVRGTQPLSRVTADDFAARKAELASVAGAAEQALADAEREHNGAVRHQQRIEMGQPVRPTMKGAA